MNEVVLEWIGYVASMIVLVSLLMSSIKKLRWINLFGAFAFGFYGFMIGSVPTGLMNLGIVIIDVYYLVKMYGQKDFFRVLPIHRESNYIKMFLDFYKADIESFSTIDEEKLYASKIRFFVLRNMTPAGIFIADEVDKESLVVNLDYVVPQYRDFKVGNFVFTSQKEYFNNLGYKVFIAETTNKDHVTYVKKMGFIEDPNKENVYIKTI